MESIYDVSMTLLTTLGIGLLIGIERGWSERTEDEGDRIAGIRTFTLVGLLGGVWALIAQSTSDLVLAAAFLGLAGLIVSTYFLDVRRRDDIGVTTEVALMLTFSLAAWSAYGEQIPALAFTVVVVALLGYKPTLHLWLRKIEPVELFAAIKLLIISVVLLPLLPNQAYGPWETLNPYWIWWMIVLISGLSFLGYVAIRIFGEQLGTLITAVAGSLVSSTAVTISLARFARERSLRGVYTGGVLLAGAIMFIRVLVVVAVVNPALVNALWLPVAAIVAIMLAGSIVLWRRRGADADESTGSLEVQNPLRLSMAVKFGLLLIVILMLSHGMEVWFGDVGIYAVSIASGFVEVDAIVLSLSRLATTDLGLDVAALGIVLASATNTLVKGAIFGWIVGYRKSVRLILAMIAALVPGLLLAAYLI